MMKKVVVFFIGSLLICNSWGQQKNVAPVIHSASSAPVKSVQLGADTLTDIPAMQYPPELFITDLSLSNVENENFISSEEMGCLRFNIKNTGQGEAYNLRLFITEINEIEGLIYNSHKFIVKQLKPGESRTDSITIEGRNNLRDGQAHFELILAEANGYKSPATTISFLTRSAGRNNMDIMNYDIFNIKSDRELQIMMTVKNTGALTMKEVNVHVHYPATVYVKGEPVKTLQTLKPGESAELDFVFVKNQTFNENLKDVFHVKIEDKNGRPLSMQREIIRIPDNSTDNKNHVKTDPSDVDVNIPVPSNNNKKDHIYVLIIGNEKYPHNQDVPYAENDARIFEKYCIKTFNIPFQNVILLINATGNQMKEGIRELARNAIYDSKGEAELIVYYSGHGVIAKDKYSFADDEFDQYLIPVDVTGADASLSISRKDIYAAFNETPMKRASIFLDACNIPIDRAVSKVAKYEWKGNVFVFASSTPNQSSITYHEKKHGLFTYFLLKCFQEHRGKINYNELTEKVTHSVTRHSDNMSDKKQTPEIIVSPQTGDSWKKWQVQQ